MDLLKEFSADSHGGRTEAQRVPPGNASGVHIVELQTLDFLFALAAETGFIRLVYFTTDWKRSDCRRLENWLSDEAKLTSRVPPEESIVVSSIACFSAAVPLIFL